MITEFCPNCSRRMTVVRKLAQYYEIHSGRPILVTTQVDEETPYSAVCLDCGYEPELDDETVTSIDMTC